ncbi:MAG: hypothetical protein CL902_00710 [Dehalococcoidia bacterium]|nr:hypothetical protein [Dehalococcoidia bacterium]
MFVIASAVVIFLFVLIGSVVSRCGTTETAFAIHEDRVRKVEERAQKLCEKARREKTTSRRGAAWAGEAEGYMVALKMIGKDTPACARIHKTAAAQRKRHCAPPKPLPQTVPTRTMIRLP